MASATSHTEQADKKVLVSSVGGEYLVVRRPRKVESLLMVLTDLENFSERIADDHSYDLGSSGGAPGGSIGNAAAASQISPRAQAQQQLPRYEVMRTRLTRHLEHDIRKMERKAIHLARHGGQGSAYVLNELYAKIRKLQAFIAEIARAAVDVLERLYMRVFVDQQELV